MIPYPRESCLNMETPVGGEWGKIWMIFIINKHHATPHNTTPRNTTTRRDQQIPRHATLHHTTTNHTTPPHTTQHHTTPYHTRQTTTPYHTPSQAKPSQKPSQAKPSQAKPSQAKQNLGSNPSWAFVLHVYSFNPNTYCRGERHSTNFDSYKTSKLVIDRKICHF